jgi:hypothetical protein
MELLYSRDLAYIHAAGFGTLARGAAPVVSLSASPSLPDR